MQPKDQKKSKIPSCWDCALRKKGGINAFGLCTWWEPGREIPANIVDVGCKFWRDDRSQEVIDKFDGELIIRR